MKTALAVNTLRKPDQPYHQQLIFPTIAGIDKGDTVLISFWARATRTTDESGVGRVSLYLQKASRPWNKSILRQLTVGEAWRHYTLPGTSDGTYAPGEAELGIGVGFLPQTVEIADVRVLTYGRNVNPSELPETVIKVSYSGQSEDAPWRSEAAARIEKHRMADIGIRVLDQAGNPVPDARLTLAMTRHQYAFGSAVVAKHLAGDTPVDRRYQEIVETSYNRIVFENDLKFGPWRAGKHPQATPERMFYHPHLLKAIDWLQARNIAIRGHTLLWGPVQEKRYYRGLDFGEGKQDTRKVLEDHLKEVLEATRHTVPEWDVINHPVAGFGDKGARLDTVYGPRIYPDIIRLTRKTNPDLRLFVNEGSIMPKGAYRTAYETHIRALFDAGTLPDGIGFMCHFGEATLTGMKELYAQLDRFAAFGLPLLATELDITTHDEDGQAAYLRDFMTLWFSHPKTEGIIMWGFWEGRHWRPDAALYRMDFSPKPAAEVWTDLVKNQWWTRETLTTGKKGLARTRGFHGEYELRVAFPKGAQKEVVTSFRLGPEGIDLTLQMPEESDGDIR